MSSTEVLVVLSVVCFVSGFVVGCVAVRAYVMALQKEREDGEV